ncbi:hypothetical protein LCGC14_0560970 [marine sediment metagenome]|uniref:Uncharacterized protein n=1 Tax=marine sediment metagenome TaxID=412755 RepID=A0A0F9U8G3_9ZZZZ
MTDIDKTKSEIAKKREEIREGLGDILRPFEGNYGKRNGVVEDIVVYLHREGVVIRYERCIGQDDHGHNFYETATEPLIETT